MMVIDDKSKSEIKLTDKESMADQEKTKNIKEIEKLNKALRLIKLGTVDIPKII